MIKSSSILSCLYNELSKQVTAEFSQKIFLCASENSEKHFFFLSPSLSPVFLPLPFRSDTAVPPTYSFHPRLYALHLSSTHTPPASIFLYLLHLSSSLSLLLKMTQVTVRKRWRSSCPHSSSVILFGSQVSPQESHSWFLFNTEFQSAGAKGTTLCLKPSQFAWGTLEDYFTFLLFFKKPKICACGLAASLSDCAVLSGKYHKF